jgi:hypothetical protein
MVRRWFLQQGRREDREGEWGGGGSEGEITEGLGKRREWGRFLARWSGSSEEEKGVTVWGRDT